MWPNKYGKIRIKLLELEICGFRPPTAGVNKLCRDEHKQRIVSERAQTVAVV